METEGQCPYCGEPITLFLDEAGGDAQRYVEDCAVCCRPIDVLVGLDENGELQANLKRMDE
jgi:hypothetical protein